MHSDTPGRLPITLRHGHNYAALVSVYNKYITVEPMVSRRGPEFVKAFYNTLSRLAALGHKPTVQRLDNETSGVLEKFMREQRITMEFVPPNNHRANRAERAIQDFKNHMLSALAGCRE